MNTEKYSEWLIKLSTDNLYSELRNLETLIKVSKNKIVLELAKTKKQLVEKQLKTK